MKPHIYRFLAALEGALTHQGPLLTGRDVSVHHRLPATKLLRVYKALEPGKSTDVRGWADRRAAEAAIADAVAAYPGD